MKTRLKKKGKNSVLIFPFFYAQQSEQQSRSKVQKQHVNKKEFEPPRLNRMFNKSKQKLKAFQSRSLSLKQRSIINSVPILNKQKQLFHTKSKKSLDKTRSSKSTIQISNIYYQGMEKYLQRQCEDILKEQSLSNVLSPFKVESLQNNLLFIKRKPSKAYLQYYKDSHEKPIIKVQKKRSGFSGSSTKKDSPNKIIQNNQSFSMLYQVTEMKDSQVSQSNQSNTENDNDSSGLRIVELRKTILAAGPGQFNSQMLARLKLTSIYFLSSKFAIRFPTFFHITRVQILQSQTKTYSLSLLAEFYGELVHKTISYNPTRAHRRKGQDRKRGNLKKLQLAKDRMKQKLLSHLMQEYNENVFLQFHHILLLYFEHYLNLERSFRGLILMDFEECGLESKGKKQQLWDPVEERKCFYFMLKLSYTFYLIRVVVQQTDLLFIFLYDFTTHSVGDHLSFSRPVSYKFKAVHYEFQTVQLFLSAIEEFQEKSRDELVGERSSQKQIQQRESNARIGKITSPPLQRWNGPFVDCQWNINKEYYLMGGITNFFRFHNNFDYGYFHSVHPENRVDQYIYCLSENNNLQVYRYPYKYSILKLTQIEQETLLIPHITGQLTPMHSKNCIRQFFKHKQWQNKKDNSSQWVLHLGINQIRCQTKQDKLEMFMQSSITLRCNKVTIPLQRMGVKHQKESPNLQELNLQIQKTLKSYKLVKRFIYSRPTQLQQHLEIYQKRLEKFDGHYAYITLYALPLHRVVQFKILMFKLSRQFIIRVEPDNEQPNYNKLTIKLVNFMKNKYFKKLLKIQSQKIKQRRLLLLQDFYKHHGKNYTVNSRKQIHSQKNDIRRRTPTVTITTLVYQNIISEVYRSKDGFQYYISIRYCPSEELREREEWKDQTIQICVHQEQRVSYFKCLVTMSDLVHSVSQGRLTLQHLDYRKAHDFFKEVHRKIKVILSTTSHSGFNLVVDRLRNFIRSRERPLFVEINPFILRLAMTALIEGKDPLITNTIQSSQMSIDFELDKQPSIISSSVRNSFLPVFGSDQVQNSISHFSFNCIRNFEQPYMRSVREDYYIEARSIFRKGDNFKLLREYKFIERQVWILDRRQGSKRLLGEWQVEFVGDILLKQSNRRMFRRLVKSVTVFL